MQRPTREHCCANLPFWLVCITPTVSPPVYPSPPSSSPVLPWFLPFTMPDTAMKVKTESSWRPQVVGDYQSHRMSARGMGCPPERPTTSRPSREKCTMVPEVEKEESAKPFDFRHRTIGFGIAPAGFLNLVLVQYFLAVSMFLYFGMVMYILY